MGDSEETAGKILEGHNVVNTRSGRIECRKSGERGGGGCSQRVGGGVG